MPPIDWIIEAHVAAGTLWVVATLVTAVSGRARKWLLGLQLGAAVVAVLAGIVLWHALHAGRDGSREHILAIGTFCALIAVGPQAAVAVPALIRTQDGARLSEPALLLYRLSTGLLILAAAAMLGSLRA